MSRYLMWAWHLGSPYVEECDSLEEAVGCGKSGEDYGNHSYSHIEERVDGTWSVVPGSRVREVWDQLDAQDDAERKVERTPTHVIEVAALDASGSRTGEAWATVGRVYDGNPWPALGGAEMAYGIRVRARDVRLPWHEQERKALYPDAARGMS